MMNEVALKIPNRSDICEFGHTLREFWDCKSTEILVVGPLGSGKTFTLQAKLLRHHLDLPVCRDGIRRGRILVCRPTQGDLESTHADLRQFFAIIAGDSRIELGHHSSSGKTMHYTLDSVKYKSDSGAYIKSEKFFWNGAPTEIVFRFMQCKTYEDRKKLFAEQASALWLPEFRQSPEEAYANASARVGRFPSRALVYDEDWDEFAPVLFGDSNSCEETDWPFRIWKEQEEAKKNGSYDPSISTFFRQPGAVRLKPGANPSANSRDIWEVNPEAENQTNLQRGLGYYKRLLRSQKVDEIPTNLANEWGISAVGERVLKQYSEAMHRREGLEWSTGDFILGMDPGFHMAVLIFQWDADHTQLRVMRELVTNNKSAMEYAQPLKQFVLQAMEESGAERHKIWIDPAANRRSDYDSRTVMDALKNAGLNVEAIDNDKNSVSYRVEAANSYLMRVESGQPLIVVDRSCEKLREAMLKGWVYAEKKDIKGEFSDTPTKGMASHICDAFCYGCVGALETPLKDYGYGAVDGMPREVYNRMNESRNDDTSGPILLGVELP